eukprot:TRINITY_DN197_c0_g1_i1.p2 TRINITY_DN197_c0_g1~~TRINITY_DN197_c0_g1_i1.p2  ORF type:complete len:190 (-),score=16.03 TRINITY_DN197_c0_g1_i1:182-751(-)
MLVAFGCVIVGFYLSLKKKKKKKPETTLKFLFGFRSQKMENQLQQYKLDPSSFEVEQIRTRNHRGFQIESPQLIQVQIKRQLALPQWVLDPLKDTWKLIRQINAIVLPQSSTETKMVYKESSLKSSEHVQLPPDIAHVLSQKSVQSEDQKKEFLRRKRPQYLGPRFGAKEIILFHLTFFFTLDYIDRKF